MSKGTLGILNVGAGDIKLSFDKSNPMERARAARMLTDMLKHGYVIFIETGTVEGKPTYQRVLEFKEDVCEYIIADLAAPVEEENANDEQSGETPSGEGSAEAGAPIARASVPRANRGGRPRKSVDASQATGIAVARSAGG